MIIKSGAWVEINLNNIEDNLKEIKKLNFYEELLETIKLRTKSLEKKTFPIYGGVYLIYAGVLYWIKGWI